jgi:hypothetical protein
MAHKATHQHADSSSTQVPVVLFGVDQNGKPKAARFVEKYADLAIKAAAHLKLRVLPIVGPAVTDLAGRLPARAAPGFERLVDPAERDHFRVTRRPYHLADAIAGGREHDHVVADRFLHCGVQRA